MVKASFVLSGRESKESDLVVRTASLKVPHFRNQSLTSTSMQCAVCANTLTRLCILSGLLCLEVRGRARTWLVPR